MGMLLDVCVVLNILDFFGSAVVGFKNMVVKFMLVDGDTQILVLAPMWAWNVTCVV